MSRQAQRHKLSRTLTWGIKIFFSKLTYPAVCFLFFQFFQRNCWHGSSPSIVRWVAICLVPDGTYRIISVHFVLILKVYPLHICSWADVEPSSPMQTLSAEKVIASSADGRCITKEITDWRVSSNIFSCFFSTHDCKEVFWWRVLWRHMILAGGEWTACEMHQEGCRHAQDGMIYFAASSLIYPFILTELLPCDWRAETFFLSWWIVVSNRSRSTRM